jgi:hypothetical protein
LSIPLEINEKRAVNFRAMVVIASIVIWLDA